MNYKPALVDRRRPRQGLFPGIELVREPRTLEPAAREAAWVVEEMKNRGVLLAPMARFIM